MSTLLVDEIIDKRKFGAFQAMIFFICFLIALMDGANIQTMGLSAPLIAADLHLSASQLGPIFAGSEIGFMIGALIFGPLADRLGRKKILVCCTLIFGLASLATVKSGSFNSLFALRVLTGVGLGGAAPCFVSLTTEYVAERLRARVASLLWAAIPAGGVVAGLAGAHLIPAFGWQSMFYAAGAVPVISALLVVLFVPESLRFLISKGKQGAVTDVILARLGVDVGRNMTPLRLTSRESSSRGMPMSQLFSHGRGLFTALLWLAFFLNFLTLIGVLAWTSTLLRSAGMTVAAASVVLAWNNVGGMIGVAMAGKSMEKFGTFGFLSTLLACGAAVVAATGWAVPQTATVALFSMLTGLLVGGATSGLIGLAAMAYPTAMRSTGVGWGLAVGRLGGASGPLLVGALVASGFDTTRTFALIALPSLFAAFAVLAMRRSGARLGPNEQAVAMH
jgi:MFS transporter, AAHS family, 4-hydroxybenzoate transporter